MMDFFLFIVSDFELGFVNVFIDDIIDVELLFFFYLY